MAYYQDLIVLQENFLKCLLCEEAFKNQDREIELHLDSKKHKEHYMKRLMHQNSIIIQNFKLFCNSCSCEVEIDGLTDHVESPNHCKYLSTIRNAIEKDGNFMRISNDKNNIHCIICNCDVDFYLQTAKSHLKLSKHQRAKAMVLQPLNGIFSVEDHDNILWCKICQRYFDNYIELIMQHVEEKEHSETMDKIKKLINGQTINIEHYLQSPKQDKAFCKKCNIEVSCNVDNLQSHIEGKKHKSK